MSGTAQYLRGVLENTGTANLVSQGSRTPSPDLLLGKMMPDLHHCLLSSCALLEFHSKGELFEN